MMIMLARCCCDNGDEHADECPAVAFCATGPSSYLLTQQGMDWETASIPDVENTCFDSGSPITLPTGCEGTVDYVSNSCAWNGSAFSLDGGDLDDFDSLGTTDGPAGLLLCWRRVAPAIRRRCAGDRGPFAPHADIMKGPHDENSIHRHHASTMVVQRCATSRA